MVRNINFKCKISVICLRISTITQKQGTAGITVLPTFTKIFEIGEIEAYFNSVMLPYVLEVKNAS